MEFSVRDFIFVKVSLVKGAMRFKRAGKLAPRYIGPFPILERIGPLAYQAKLPKRLLGIHNVDMRPNTKE